MLINVLRNYLIVHFDLQITFFMKAREQLLNDVIILLSYKHNHFELHN